MTVDLRWAAAESRRIKAASRRLCREIQQAAEEQATEIARLRLPAGEPLEREVLDLLDRARGSDLTEVLIIVSQSDPDPDQESN